MSKTATEIDFAALVHAGVESDTLDYKGPVNFATLPKSGKVKFAHIQIRDFDTGGFQFFGDRLIVRRSHKRDHRYGMTFLSIFVGKDRDDFFRPAGTQFCNDLQNFQNNCSVKNTVSGVKHVNILHYTSFF